MNWKQSKFLGTRQFCASHLTAHPIWDVIRCLFSHRGAYIALFIMDLALAEHFLIHFLSRLFKRQVNLSLRHESGRVTIFLRSWGLSSPFSLAELSLSSTASSSLASGDIASLMSPCLLNESLPYVNFLCHRPHWRLIQCVNATSKFLYNDKSYISNLIMNSELSNF